MFYINKVKNKTSFIKLGEARARQYSFLFKNYLDLLVYTTDFMLYYQFIKKTNKMIGCILFN